MSKIRFDLINETLYGKHADGLKYHQFKLSKRNIEKLFNNYYIAEFCENFYDSEYDYDDETYDMYLDYVENFELTGRSFWEVITKEDQVRETRRFSKQEHTREEYKQAYETIKQQQKDYEETRLTQLSWVEPYFKGNWNMSQEIVDKIAYENLEDFRKHMPHQGRCYLTHDKENDVIKIYLYGRDIGTRDLWFIFQRRKRRLDKLIKIKNIY